MAREGKASRGIPLIGALAVKNQLITEAELEAGLIQCREAEDPDAVLKDYLLSNELVSSKNVHRLTLAAKAITIRQKEYKFGAIAMSKGYINRSVLDLALEDQQKDIRNGRKPRLIGDMMVEAGLITQSQRDSILRLQNRVRKSPGQQSGSGKAGPAGQKRPSAAQTPDRPGSIDEEVPPLLEPEMIVGGIRLQVAGDFMAAFLSKTDQFNPDVLVSEIKETLFEKGIVAGIVSDEMVQGFIDSSGFKTQAFRVAKGIRPIQGRDAKIEFFFNTDYLKAGGMDESGTIDFRQRGQIPLVEKGTVLAEKTPRVEARRGETIYGDEVETRNGEDQALRFGKGAALSEDGLKLLANVRGYPKYSLSGVIFVHEEYITPGDVDYETGHVEFDGNVSVKGCIKSGFKVRGADIAAVELDGGIVEAEGDLTVAGGINESTIYARGNVYAKFIHKSEIVCMGNVHVQKEIVDSTIQSSGACVITNGKLISSRVTAKMGLMARHIGTEMAGPSRVKVGYDVFTEKELKKNKARTARLKEKIFVLQEKKAEYRSRNTRLQKEITHLAHTQDRAQLDQRDLEKQIKTGAGDQAELTRKMAELRAVAQDSEKQLDACFEKSEAVEGLMGQVDANIDRLTRELEDQIQERTNLTQWAKENPGKAEVAVDGAMLPGTAIIGKHSEYTADNLIRHARLAETLFKTETDEGPRTVYTIKVNNY